MLRQKSYIGRIFRIAFGITVLAVLFLTGGADAADPDLVVTEINAPDQASIGERININWTVENQGDGTAIGQSENYWADGLYLSIDNVLDSSDIYQVSNRRWQQPLIAGANYTTSINYQIPDISSGNYYLFIKTDGWPGPGYNDPPNGRVYESNEDNNILTKLIVIKKSDLVVEIIAPDQASARENVQINWTVKNQGNGTAIGQAENYWADSLYFSTDNVLDSSDIHLGSYWRWQQPLIAGTNYTASINVQIPDIPSGNYYLLVKTDGWPGGIYTDPPNGRVYESDEDNNILAEPITIGAADLVVIDIVAQDQASVGERIIVNWTVKNQGDIRAKASWANRLYISNDSTLDDSDILLSHYLMYQPLASNDSYDVSVNINMPDISSGDYHLIAKADYWNNILESREWNNILTKRIAIGVGVGFSEIASNQSTLIEELLSQKANLSSGIVKGDLNGTFSFTDFEIVSVNSGSFTGKGFSKGEWLATLDGTSYRGRWEGVSYFIPAEKRIYLKGYIAGGEASGIVEGYLTESTPNSGIYDKYHATWRLGRLADRITSVTLNLEGNFSYQGSLGYPSTRIYALQTSVEGTTFGDYKENLSTVLTHLRVSDETNPYHGQGFSIISYTSNSGQGEGWAYNRLVASGKTELRGMFTRPLQGIVSGTLDETSLPRKLYFTIERIDLGLPPAPNLKVKVWGPGRVSPGQTIDYIIEYRNDGVKASESAILVIKLPSDVESISNTGDGAHNIESHEVIWRLGTISPMSKKYLTSKIRTRWALPLGTQLRYVVYIPREDSDVLIDPSINITHEIFEYTNDSVRVISYISGESTNENSNINISLGKVVAEKTEPVYEVNEITLDRMNISWKFFVESNSWRQVEIFQEISNAGLDAIERGENYQDTVAAKNRGQDFLDWCFKEKGYMIKEDYDYQSKLLKSTPAFRIGRDVLSWLLGRLPWIGPVATEAFELGNEMGEGIVFGANDNFLWERMNRNSPNLLSDLLNSKLPLKENSLSGLWEYYLETNSQSTNSATSVLDFARDPNIKYGPEGFVLPGQKLNYTVEFENEGEGIAFGVYFTDTLDEDLDVTTLEIGPVISTIDGSVIAPSGTYNPSTRTITWLVGEVGSREGGYTNLSVNVRSDAEERTEIINYATVYFPSVPEATRTNGIVSVVDITPPRYSNVNQNKSVVNAGEANEVSSYWRDGVQLNYTWLETNESGTWQNVSYLKLSWGEAWSNFTIQTTKEGVACWRIHANDTAGNENATPALCFDVMPSLDAMPPLSVTEPGLLAASATWLNFTWNNPPDADFSHVMLYLNGSFITNVYAPQNFYNVTSLSPDTFYELSTHTVDTSGNINETWVNATGRTLSLPDTAPPASVDLLHNTTYAQTYINWTWTDPTDSDFANVSVWIDGVFKDNIQKAILFYNATGFAPDSEHTIATRTIDTNGNINQTWQNHTARTAPEFIIPPVKVKLTFIVTDNNLPIANATVQSGGNFKGETNESGTVTFEVPIGVYKYAVREKGYVRATGTVNVADETTVNVKLTPRKYV
jgi:uncharacterized repeat protein (TIGR01451 family)